MEKSNNSTFIIFIFEISKFQNCEYYNDERWVFR